MPRVDRTLKVEGGRLWAQDLIKNEAVLESTERLRSAELLRRGDRAKIGPDRSEVIWAFQVDPDEWAHFRRDHPDLVSALQSRDQIPREAAAQTIARMHPEWVASSPRIFLGAQSNGR